MKRHYEQAIWPLILTAGIFGLALIENPRTKKRIFLGLLYAAVSCCLQISLQTIKAIYLLRDDVLLVDFVRTYMLIALCFTTFILIYFSQWNGKRFYRCLAVIHEADETLRELGIKTDYSKLRRVVLVALVTWASGIVILNAMDAVTVPRESEDIYGILSIIILDIPIHAPMLIDMQFWCIMRYIETRFDCINYALRELILDDNDWRGWSQNNKVTSVRRAFILNEKNKRIIRTMMHLHFQLCEVSHEVTRAFGAQIFVEVAFSFHYVLCSIIFTFCVILVPFEGDKYTYYILIWLWSFAYILKIVTINCICESVAAKAMRVSTTFEGLLRVMDDEKMRKDILLIGLQIKQKPLRFSCLGFYYLGYEFLCEIFCSMVTMTVIILQMKIGLPS